MYIRRFAGNIFGVEHERIIEEGVFLVKVKDHEYIKLDEILARKRKKLVIKDFATKKRGCFCRGFSFIKRFGKTKNSTKEKNNIEVFLPNCYNEPNTEEKTWNLSNVEHQKFKARMYKQVKIQ